MLELNKVAWRREPAGVGDDFILRGVLSLTGEVRVAAEYKHDERACQKARELVRHQIANMAYGDLRRALAEAESIALRNCHHAAIGDLQRAIKAVRDCIPQP
jgi:hypothetical protein